VALFASLKILFAEGAAARDAAGITCRSRGGLAGRFAGRFAGWLRGGGSDRVAPRGRISTGAQGDAPPSSPAKCSGCRASFPAD
jgi:hypothetical protein